MSNMAPMIDRALDVAATIIDGIDADGWRRPTPCPGWTARDVYNHLVEGVEVFAQLVAGRDGGATPVGTVDSGDATPLERFVAAATDDRAAWSAPAAGTVRLGFGEIPLGLAAMVHLTEIVVHGIDLAVATGQCARIDEALAGALLDGMHAAGGIDPYRVPGMFGPELMAVQTDAAHRRLLAYVGRTMQEAHDASDGPSTAPPGRPTRCASMATVPVT